MSFFCGIRNSCKISMQDGVTNRLQLDTILGHLGRVFYLYVEQASGVKFGRSKEGFSTSSRGSIAITVANSSSAANLSQLSKFCKHGYQVPFSMLWHTTLTKGSFIWVKMKHLAMNRDRYWIMLCRSNQVSRSRGRCQFFPTSIKKRRRQ